MLKTAAGPQPETEGNEDSVSEKSAEYPYQDPAAAGPMTPNRPRPSALSCAHVYGKVVMNGAFL